MVAEVEAALTLIGLPPSNVTRDASEWVGPLLAKYTMSTACVARRVFLWRLPFYLFLVGSFIVWLVFLHDQLHICVVRYVI